MLFLTEQPQKGVCRCSNLLH